MNDYCDQVAYPSVADDCASWCVLFRSGVYIGNASQSAVYQNRNLSSHFNQAGQDLDQVRDATPDLLHLLSKIFK